jgi:hypothetical protein
MVAPVISQSLFIDHRSGSKREDRALIDAEAIGQPVQHILLRDRRVVVLAVLGPRFLGGEELDCDSSSAITSLLHQSTPSRLPRWTQHPAGRAVHDAGIAIAAVRNACRDSGTP